MFLGGLIALNIISSIAIGTFRYATKLKLRKDAVPCGICKQKGFIYANGVKAGSANIKWSPLYDPIAFNPCLCPTCDGNKLAVFYSLLPCNFCFTTDLGIAEIYLYAALFDMYCRVQLCLNCLGKGYTTGKM
ncbi:uncharacterized protein LOC110600618 [Manihot esculenta]|uniref:Uncharacterized protein n=1 Tax=Manihot esculenta TaxID=3983 RepID=A0A251JCB1_MANES|nr:uncharacterized protein LOC110600618 [Manihot esculenta]